MGLGWEGEMGLGCGGGGQPHVLILGGAGGVASARISIALV